MLVLCPSLLKMLSCLCMQGVYKANGVGSLSVLRYRQDYPWNPNSAHQIHGLQVENLIRVTVHCPCFKTVTRYSDSFL